MSGYLVFNTLSSSRAYDDTMDAAQFFSSSQKKAKLDRSLTLPSHPYSFKSARFIHHLTLEKNSRYVDAGFLTHSVHL
jgi:hypothetical protein